MPSVRLANAVAAATTVPNIMAGNRFEFLPTRALIRVYAAAAGAAGLVEGEVLATISLTNVVLLDGGAVPVIGTALAGAPNRNEHQILPPERGDGGDRLIISLTNTDAAIAATVVTIVDLAA